MASENKKPQDESTQLEKVAIWQRFIWWNKRKPTHNNSASYKIILQIKKYLASKNSKLKLPDNRPWYLLIGTEAGKTSSLLYSDFAPIAPNEQKIGHIIKTSDIDAWEDNEKIILECSSDAFSARKKLMSKLIDTLPQTLKLTQAPSGIDGIIIMLKADDFSSTPAQFAKMANPFI